jgi:hypothetical protein
MIETPDDLRGLDHRLRSVRFCPRASFGPELMGRIRRGDQPSGAPPRSYRRHLASAAVAVIAAGSALALANLGQFGGANAVTVDRCCYDLDGGAEADDGVLILAERDARVHRLRVYEDLDGSGNYTPGDLVRLDRGGEPAVHGLAGDGVTTIERCCLDFDGGGRAVTGCVGDEDAPRRVRVAEARTIVAMLQRKEVVVVTADFMCRHTAGGQAHIREHRIALRQQTALHFPHVAQGFSTTRPLPPHVPQGSTTDRPTYLPEPEQSGQVCRCLRTDSLNSSRPCSVLPLVSRAETKSISGFDWISRSRAAVGVSPLNVVVG